MNFYHFNGGVYNQNNRLFYSLQWSILNIIVLSFEKIFVKNIIPQIMTPVQYSSGSTFLARKARTRMVGLGRRNWEKSFGLNKTSQFHAVFSNISQLASTRKETRRQEKVHYLFCFWLLYWMRSRVWFYHDLLGFFWTTITWPWVIGQRFLFRMFLFWHWQRDKSFQQLFQIWRTSKSTLKNVCSKCKIASLRRRVCLLTWKDRGWITLRQLWKSKTCWINWGLKEKHS